MQKGLSNDFENRRWSNMDQSLCFRHKAALDFINPNQTLLDLGCGDGLFLEIAKQKGAICTGADQSEVALNKCRGRFGDTVNLVKLDVASGALPFPENSYEVVSLLDVLEHVLEPEKLLNEAKRVSSKYIIISVPNFSSLPARLQCLFGKVPENNKPKKGHVYWFNYSVLKKMLKDNNLKIVELKYNTQGGNMPGIKQLFMLLGKLWPNLFALSFVVLAEKES